jgi:uncharacterized protein YlxW (UPF0749 family)
VRSRSAQVSLTIVCFIVGALLMIQFRTQGHISKVLVNDTGADQTAIISNLYDSNLDLRREVEKLHAQQAEYASSFTQSDLADMVGELNKLRVFNGTGQVSGQGVELSVGAQIRAEDVQDLTNELRNAGAEAIAVNDQRMVASSAISTYKGQVVIDRVIVDPPYVFRAIGPASTLEGALQRKGGMLSYLRNTYPEAEITLTRQPKLTLPMSGSQRQFQVAEVVR